MGCWMAGAVCDGVVVMQPGWIVRGRRDARMAHCGPSVVSGWCMRRRVGGSKDSGCARELVGENGGTSFSVMKRVIGPRAKKRRSGSRETVRADGRLAAGVDRRRKYRRSAGGRAGSPILGPTQNVPTGAIWYTSSLQNQ